MKWKIILCILIGICSNLKAQENCYLIEQKLKNKTEIPQSLLKPLIFKLQEKEAIVIPVYNENDFSKTDFSKKVIFDIQCDIKLSRAIKLNSSKGILINGNGHKIFQGGIPLKIIKTEGKWNIAEYNKKIWGDETFLTSNGHVLRLAKSQIEKAESWSYNDTTEIVTMRLPSPWEKYTIKESDNVFINYSMWFIRQKDRVLSLKNGILKFKCTKYDKPNGPFIRWTPSPFFYFDNFHKNNNEILIKNNKLYFPSVYKHLSQSNQNSIITISENTLLECNNLSFGTALKCMIDNRGKALFKNCVFENSDSEGINSKGSLIVKNCIFKNINGNAIYSHINSTAHITHSTFKNIGKYGTNIACITTKGDTYIGKNKFRDFNYSAMIVGYMSTDILKDIPTTLIEYNDLSWSPEWAKQMQLYGLNDSGAIYVGTNNKQCIVRYNTITNFGGLEGNRGIFCDDGAYNVAVYGNILNNTDTDYDIISWNCSLNNTRKKPKENSFNSNNFIGYNICTRPIKAEGNPHIKNNKCRFINNIILGDSIKTVIHSVSTNKISGNNIPQNKKAVVFDLKGKIKNNIYYPSINYFEEIFK